MVPHHKKSEDKIQMNGSFTEGKQRYKMGHIHIVVSKVMVGKWSSENCKSATVWMMLTVLTLVNE
jgi:hypothetical protein